MMLGMYPYSPGGYLSVNTMLWLQLYVHISFSQYPSGNRTSWQHLYIYPNISFQQYISNIFMPIRICGVDSVVYIKICSSPIGCCD